MIMKIRMGNNCLFTITVICIRRIRNKNYKLLLIFEHHFFHFCIMAVDVVSEI